MNTDQAFDLLKDAGVTEDASIQIVRRWLREGKIKYEGGNRDKKAGYIIDDAKQVYDLLKDARVTESMSIQIVRRWLREDKIKHEENGNGEAGYIMDDTTPKLLINDRIDGNMNEVIHRLKLKVHAQNKQIEGMKELHRTENKGLIQQRDKLKKEVAILRHETSKLQTETKDLLKENIELRNELRKLRESKREHYNFTSTTQVSNYSKKLGLSQMAGNKEVLAEYKGLLKAAHPDRGGDEKLFHYIKTDYENFRNSIKDYFKSR